jgi:hypothetical protein
MDNFGFIITRHVISEETNKYWNHCLLCIRRFYPMKKIVVIDDNSNYDFVVSFHEHTNIVIIDSEYKGCGEFLPYYYYYKHNFFHNAVIIHDSVFFHRRVNFEKLINLKVIPLWHFNADSIDVENSKRIIKNMKNTLDIYEKLSLNTNVLGLNHLKWYGCFGCQTFINYHFLCHLQNKYNIMSMVNHIKCRKDRCCLERILGCIFFTENTEIERKKSIFGNIMNHHKKFSYTFSDYYNDLKTKLLPFSIIKIWTGR